MSQVETAVDSSVVSVYPDHGSAEAALRRLIEAARNQLREGLLADGLVEEAGELATASGAAK